MIVVLSVPVFRIFTVFFSVCIYDKPFYYTQFLESEDIDTSGVVKRNKKVNGHFFFYFC